MKDSLPDGAPRRTLTASRKIPARESRFNAAFYLQVDRAAPCRCCGCAEVVGVQFKTPGKFAFRWVDWFLRLLNWHLEAEFSGRVPDWPVGAPPDPNGPAEDNLPDPDPSNSGEDAS